MSLKKKVGGDMFLNYPLSSFVLPHFSHFLVLFCWFKPGVHRSSDLRGTDVSFI